MRPVLPALFAITLALPVYAEQTVHQFSLYVSGIKAGNIRTPILLPTWETNNPQTTKIQRGDAILKLTGILKHLEKWQLISKLNKWTKIMSK